MKKLFLLFIAIIPLYSFGIDYGIDRLENGEYDALLEGKNLAVLTHAAGLSKNGNHLIDILNPKFHLVKIFSPEHGLRTQADQWVEDGVDAKTGLPVISLYKRSKAPDPKDLVGIDAVVIDLQDVGVRYYTYFSTIAEVMRVTGPLNIQVIILDRPNLLGGTIMEGAILDQDFARRFTGYHTVPTRHAMTLGELAQMVNAENKYGSQLIVIPAKGWHRENLISSIDRPWTPPSPAIVVPEQVGLYALWGILENFNLAVGRGQTNELAFRVLGAPWISAEEAEQLAQKLNALGFNGIQFKAHEWLVTRSVFNGELARGVYLEWNQQEVRTDEFTYKVSQTLYAMFDKKLTINNLMIHIMGSKAMFEAIKAQTPWTEFKQKLDQDLEKFKTRSVPYLLY
jgi:uncharacterized protein YbbC (DUF1343 family)